MLSKILSKETCRTCKFCCSFRRQSLWETPLFSPVEKEMLESKYQHARFRLCENGSYTIDLAYGFKTKSPSEEVSCFFLDSNTGCNLEKDEKPFDCSIWPFRLMSRNGLLLIALTPTCPAVNAIPLEHLKSFVADGLAATIFCYGKNHQYIIKDYREGFPVVLTESEFLRNRE